MTEHDLFVAALHIEAPADRSAYLDKGCAGDDSLRHRVEALLRAHVRAGDFMGTPAVAAFADDTRTGPAVPDGGDGLDFLTPSDNPESFGRLGHYEVQEVVGRGGMGVVLKAFDENLHRVVAVKVMAPQLASSAIARRRFTREARAAAAVTHDHVVTIHAVEDAGPRPYIVMQYVAGVSLQDRIDRTGPLQLREILRIGMQTASGLAAAHAQGLVHRDVKPANILLENGVERVKITDFGLARAADDASLTQPGVVAGTPAFMSPEQAEGKPVDHRSDLFSLGSVLYAMCTGRPPFRSGTSMGVLKRVCDETPTPIRETNPEVPDWLAAAVERLHAKDPAARFQSAAEVAELLGRHLAHVQHPSVVPLPAVVKPAEGLPKPTRPERRNRWAVAAAVLAAVLMTVGATDATGVTNVRGTIIRVFTPDGTLVVETDDPNVKVTVEGDGGLIITGAGLQEIRLKPGSYRVLAARDGQRVPLERELVTVSRGGREIVRVKLEAPPAPPVAKGEPGAFVLLADGKERKFDTLTEAVLGASDGDTIEVRGNGPFVTESLEIHARTLTIRAGHGSWPVIRLSPQGSQAFKPMLSARGEVLVLEGLEFQRLGQREWTVGEEAPYLIATRTAALHIANCRFRLTGSRYSVCVSCFAPFRIRNCEFLGFAYGIEGGGVTASPRILENCVHVGGEALTVPPGAEVRLTRNTLVCREHVLMLPVQFPLEVLEKSGVAGPARVEASANVFDGRVLLTFLHQPASFAGGAPPERADAEAMLRRMLAWRDRGNLYREGSISVNWCVGSLVPKAVFPLAGKSPADWKRFWNDPKSEATEGRLRYQGGDLLARAATAPDQLSPEDFRLRLNSAGYRAGKYGKDLGADVDLVGPGKGYEQWKATPDYQQWLGESGQVKK